MVNILHTYSLLYIVYRYILYQIELVKHMVVIFIDTAHPRNIQEYRNVG